MPVSPLLATQTPTPNAIPISDGSGSLNAWITDGSGGGGDIQALLDSISNVQGSVLFRSATQWEALEPGVPGGFLMTNGSGADPTWSLGSDALVAAWKDLVDSNGGTYEADSIDIARDLAAQLQLASYYSKIIYLMPLLGANLAAARCPLVDVLGRGIAGNTAFVDADFTQATGLQGDGTTKYLDTLYYPGEIGASGKGGMGFIENNFVGTGNHEPMGCYQTPGAPFNQFILFILTTVNGIVWGDSTQPAVYTVTGVNAHYYGQRFSATLLEAFVNGVSGATNTVSVTPVHTMDKTILVLGSNQTPVTPYQGRCACAYMTDGTMSSLEVADFHTLLSTYLIAPTGR